jgi:hypothetical protein
MALELMRTRYFESLTGFGARIHLVRVSVVALVLDYQLH